MSYRIFTTKTFDKDFKRCVKRGLPMDLLHEVLKQLAEIGKVDEKYHPHILSGNRRGQWECHIRPDWLLIWEQNDHELTLLMVNTGTHSDLFGKRNGFRTIVQRVLKPFLL